MTKNDVLKHHLIIELLVPLSYVPVYGMLIPHQVAGSLEEGPSTRAIRLAVMPMSVINSPDQ